MDGWIRLEEELINLSQIDAIQVEDCKVILEHRKGQNLILLASTEKQAGVWFEKISKYISPLNVSFKDQSLPKEA